MVDQPPSRESSTPGRLLKQSAVLFVFIHVCGLYILAIADAQHEAYYFRIFALALIWASVSIVVSAYLSIRCAWSGRPPADFKDGVLPAAGIAVVGWLFWTGLHLIF